MSPQDRSLKTVTQVSAGGVILDEASRIVLTARKSFKGDIQWGLPKGLVEEGEEPAQTAVREAREETGLEVELIGPLDVIDYWFVQPKRGEEAARRVHKYVHFYVMRAVGGDPSNHDAETEEVAILEPPDALKRASFGSERKMIKLVIGQAE